jgi:hypothetical protein
MKEFKILLGLEIEPTVKKASNLMSELLGHGNPKKN